ncbi:MAG: hypothetical protein WKF47_11830 [Geodermatophilaceae bacterium]
MRHRLEVSDVDQPVLLADRLADQSVQVLVRAFLVSLQVAEWVERDRAGIPPLGVDA